MLSITRHQAEQHLPRIHHLWWYAVLALVAIAAVLWTTPTH